MSCVCKTIVGCSLLESRNKELITFLDDNICPDCGERNMFEKNYRGHLLLVRSGVHCSSIDCIQKVCERCKHTFFITIYFGIIRVES